LRFKLIINRDSGTVRSQGADVLRGKLEACLREAALDGALAFVAARDLDAALRVAAATAELDLVMVGGGDGTVSAAAGILSVADKSMGVLPLGTMNLFARALGVPAEPVEALMLVRNGRVDRCDLGEINERRFSHHVTLGLHPLMTRLRERMHYASRLQKFLAAIRAYVLAVRHAPLLRLDLNAGGATRTIEASILIVSNNVLGQGPGHLPYADNPDEGLLGLYFCTSGAPIDLIALSAAALAGQWHDNPQLEAFVIDSVSIDMGSKRAELSIDGELVHLTSPLNIRALPGALQVLRP
jgi:diacylglycerol kinase family enzyme